MLICIRNQHKTLGPLNSVLYDSCNNHLKWSSYSIIGLIVGDVFKLKLTAFQAKNIRFWSLVWLEKLECLSLNTPLLASKNDITPIILALLSVSKVVTNAITQVFVIKEKAALLIYGRFEAKALTANQRTTLCVADHSMTNRIFKAFQFWISGFCIKPKMIDTF